MENEVKLQRDYYRRTAEQYNRLHVNREEDEHDLACEVLCGMARHYGFGSVLDIGSGTGRAVQRLGEALPSAEVYGVEPVAELREIGHRSGISRDRLVGGDATALDFGDSSFDLVCAFGVMHHIAKPERALSEMIRVCGKGIFISDVNRYGQGGRLMGRMKWVLARLGLWKFADWVNTRGRGYRYSETDGVSYSYSLFDHHGTLRRAFEQVIVVNLDGDGRHAELGASHVAMIGVGKKKASVRSPHC